MASIYRRQAILDFLKGIGFGLMIAAAFPLIFVGYLFSALSMFGIAILVIGFGLLIIPLAMAISRWRRGRSRQDARTITAVALALTLVLCPFLFRKRTVPLMSGGKTIAVARNPFVWGETECPVYAGDTKLFGLWSDMFDGPMYIYPFADGRRFLCIKDDDTAILVFVVDCRTTDTNAPVSSGWPPNAYARNYMAGRAPRVVIDPIGVVRLPTLEEVKEAAKYIEDCAPSELERASFPAMDLGLFRLYDSKEDLLKQLDPHRNDVWPR